MQEITMKEKDLSQRDKPNSKELDITTSYMKFIDMIHTGKFYYILGADNAKKFRIIKKEFISKVSKHDYSVSDIDEIVQWLINIKVTDNKLIMYGNGDRYTK